MYATLVPANQKKRGSSTLTEKCNKQHEKNENTKQAQELWAEQYQIINVSKKFNRP